MNTKFFLGLFNNLLVDNSKLNVIIVLEWKQKYKISKIKIDITYNSIVVIMIKNGPLFNVRKKEKK